MSKITKRDRELAEKILEWGRKNYGAISYAHDVSSIIAKEDMESIAALIAERREGWIEKMEELIKERVAHCGTRPGYVAGLRIAIDILEADNDG